MIAAVGVIGESYKHRADHPVGHNEGSRSTLISKSIEV